MDKQLLIALFPFLTGLFAYNAINLAFSCVGCHENSIFSPDEWKRITIFSLGLLIVSAALKAFTSSSIETQVVTMGTLTFLRDTWFLSLIVLIGSIFEANGDTSVIYSISVA